MVTPAADASYYAPGMCYTICEIYDLSEPIESNNGLRKELTSYGDAHFCPFLRKAFIKALGYSEDAPPRPIIGVINMYLSFSRCHGNIPQLIEAAKRDVCTV